MNLKLKRTPGIYVVGFMASGKSTVGRHLAHRLGWNFFDTDDGNRSRGKGDDRRNLRRSRRAGVPPHRSRDPAAARALDRARASRGAGAGRRRLRGIRQPRAARGTTGSRVWLDCPFETRAARVLGPTARPGRPLARDPERFAALFERAASLYRLADIRMPVETRRSRTAPWTRFWHDPIFR